MYYGYYFYKNQLLIHKCGFYVFKPILSQTVVDYILKACSLIIQMLLSEFLKSSIKKTKYASTQANI